VRVLPQEEAQAKAILARHRDNDWSLCDAISFAVLEARGIRTAFAFDRPFRQYERFEVLGPDRW
jgi:predicted nucleic acid-binding protein